MATLEDIVAASKILSGESVMGSSGSKLEENRARASDVRNDDCVSAAETIVEEKGEIDFKSISYSSSSIRVNGIDDKMDVDGSEEEFRGNEIGVDSLAVNGDGLYMDVDEGEEGMDAKLKDQENTFFVGDFVWGKIKSHPWWPGQVYDPKDASEFALKRKQEGRLLVGFFGDGTCSWCLPSQLIPFAENWSKLSTESNSKSFLKAVEMAVDEIGRVVESEMMCNCVSMEECGVARSVVENAGLKEGVLMPDVDVKRLFIPEFEPENVLGKVVELAKGVATDGALELAIVRSWLSAFYYRKGGYRLCMYQGPFHIEGLEDKNKNVGEVGSDFSVPIEVPILRPQDDDWLSSPTVGSVNSDGAVENKVSHRRKQKSVAELMGDDNNIKPGGRKRDSVKKGADSEKAKSSQKRKKSDDDGEVNTDGASTGKRGRKRKGEVTESPKITNAKDSNGLGGSDGGRLLRKRKKIEVATAEKAPSEAKEEVEIVSSPRERKKSKYLSPPYTNPAWKTGNLSSRTEMDVEHDKASKVGDELSSQPVSKSLDDASEEKRPNGQLENISEDKSLHNSKDDKKLSFSVSDVDAPVDEMLSEIELAALDPSYFRKKASLDAVLAFVSALRSSTNLHGHDYKIYQKGQAYKKRKPLPSQLGNDLSTQTKAKAPKASKTELKSVASDSKKAPATSVARTTSPRLILQFDAGFPLPSKKEIIGLFGKFGSLNKRKTKVDAVSNSIHVAYTKDADAEEALKSSLKQSPFGSANVDYRLQHPAAARKSHLSPPEKREAADDFVSDMNNVKQKLEITTAIMENYHSKFSSEDKCRLKDEMKHLMETVGTVSDMVRIMAEKTTS